MTIANLEQLQNSFKVLELMLNQSAPRGTILEWFENTNEKIEHIKTLVNREPQD